MLSVFYLRSGNLYTEAYCSRLWDWQTQCLVRADPRIEGSTPCVLTGKAGGHQWNPGEQSPYDLITSKALHFIPIALRIGFQQVGGWEDEVGSRHWTRP